MTKIDPLINKIIHSLVIDENFGIGTYHEEAVMNLIDQIYEIDKNITINYGASKAVIIIPNSFWVIKIPFYGSWWDECEEEEEEFIPFTLANDLPNNDMAREWDYCENELAKYEIAETAGYARFLPKTIFYTEKDGVYFYLQQKVTEAGDIAKTPSHKAQELYAKNQFCCSSSIDLIWLQNAIDYYGEKLTLNFLKFIKENHMDEDLHRGNLGYTEEGKPVLLDFCGFRDQ